jgi:hypothetical protein
VGGTHLYGRRLVVEYAAPDDDTAGGGCGSGSDAFAGDGLQAARARTAAQFAAGDAGGEAAEAAAPARKRMRRNL